MSAGVNLPPVLVEGAATAEAARAAGRVARVFPERVRVDDVWLELTPWFDPSVNPARPGVYEVENCYGDPEPLYRVWTGDRWVLGSVSDVRQAERSGWSRIPPGPGTRLLPWRGLAHPPGAV